MFSYPHVLLSSCPHTLEIASDTTFVLSRLIAQAIDIDRDFPERSEVIQQNGDKDNATFVFKPLERDRFKPIVAMFENPFQQLGPTGPSWS